MKKANIYKFLYVISALLVFGFGIHTIVDACRYDRMLTSFPFYAFVIVHAIEYLIPSAIVFVATLICKKKFASKQKEIYDKESEERL